MHELSIALSLLDAASERARLEGATRIQSLYLTIGPLSGVVVTALESAFEVAAAATIAEGALLHVEETPVVVFCAACCKESRLTEPLTFSCSACGSPSSDLRGGRELELTAIEIE